MVQLRSIEFLGIAERINPVLELTDLINFSPDAVEVLLALNTLVYFRDHTEFGAYIDPKKIQPTVMNDEIKRGRDYLNENC
ncbi:hypothetical protein [Algoriphagus persicinus]|uniref:hypothetical protein n=1 Tax=Algoriphagus persicinus TaxID=3108754 RepID=UPI002B3C5500|nr:hypothetical protein [Algoriphagus sp. E1-3-M2]MEB2786614.1 hypothetical protein [Algoriphagus sp. E1-3-M2]